MHRYHVEESSSRRSSEEVVGVSVCLQSPLLFFPVQIATVLRLVLSVRHGELVVDDGEQR